MKRALGSLAVVVLIVAGLFLVTPRAADRAINRVIQRPPPIVSRRAVEMMPRLRIVDLHADSLLWDRDLAKRSGHGHVDIPRLIEGRVAVQMFTVVTKMPFFAKLDRNSGRSDVVTLLAVAGRWPRRTWFDLTERALYQAQKLREAASRSQGRLVVVESVADLERYLDLRERGPEITAGLLGLEGAHALGGDLANLDRFFAAGFRMIALTHFFDNEVAGSAHGRKRGGLTEKGRELIRRMEEKGILLDLAHASEQTIREAAAMAKRPVVVSHTGVKGTCDNQRNLSDEQLRAIAGTGGVVGIGYWDVATCGGDGKAVARAIRHAVDVVGIRHVALGSDFDGATTTPFDTTGLAEVIDGLLEQQFTEQEIALIMGGNALRVLRLVLP